MVHTFRCAIEREGHVGVVRRVVFVAEIGDACPSRDAQA